MGGAPFGDVDDEDGGGGGGGWRSEDVFATSPSFRLGVDIEHYLKRILVLQVLLVLTDWLQKMLTKLYVYRKFE